MYHPSCALHTEVFQKLKKTWRKYQSPFHTDKHVIQTCSCIKHAHACMPKPHKHTHTHSMLTLPSISSVYGTRRFIHTVTHSLCWDQRYAVFSCALPFFMTLSCQCYLLQTYTQTHTRSIPVNSLYFKHTHTHTCILTNLMEAITELSPSCWLAIKCFPPLLTMLC